MLFTKTTNSLLEPPFEGVGSNVHTSSISRWKVHIVDILFAIIEHFSIAFTVEKL